MNSLNLSSTFGGVAIAFMSGAGLYPLSAAPVIPAIDFYHIQHVRINAGSSIDGTSTGAISVSTGSELVSESDFIKEVSAFYADLAARQTSLGDDFKSLTTDELWDLFA